ncbi:MAG: TolC family protein [Sediminicola sp.]
MKSIKIIAILLITVGWRSSWCQEMQENPISISLLEAMDIAKKENVGINILKTEESATLSELHEVKSRSYPKFSSFASYQRFSKITLFDGVLGDSYQLTKPPNANAGNVGVEGFLNIFNGGKQRHAIQIAVSKNDLASIDTDERSADISLQVARQYLDMVRLYHLIEIKDEQVKRAQTRLENIRSLYNNGKVTKSDLLRAELTLSKVELEKSEAQNDYRISNGKLNVLFDHPTSNTIVPSDTVSFTWVDTIAVKKILYGNNIPFAIRKNEKALAISDLQRKVTRAENLPSVALLGAYSFNYPNTFVLPPIDQSYAVGFIGIKVAYDISSIYQNKHRLNASNYRLQEVKMQSRYISENIEYEKNLLYIKYVEALKRIDVAKKSIVQSEANYKIINTKYYNQLALLSDLLDADDLYLQSQYDHKNAQISAMIIYYRMLFVSGQL